MLDIEPNWNLICHMVQYNVEKKQQLKESTEQQTRKKMTSKMKYKIGRSNTIHEVA